jgi:hypothetical protein
MSLAQAQLGGLLDLGRRDDYFIARFPVGGRDKLDKVTFVIKSYCGCNLLFAYRMRTIGVILNWLFM